MMVHYRALKKEYELIHFFYSILLIKTHQKCQKKYNNQILVSNWLLITSIKIQKTLKIDKELWGNVKWKVKLLKKK